MSFCADVKRGFCELIDSFGLAVHVESERTVFLIKQRKYLLSTSLTNHFEIDFLFCVMDGESVVAFNPMYFIGISRQDRIPRKKLTSPSVSYLDKISNYQKIFMAAGEDFFSGVDVWNRPGGPSLSAISEDDKIKVKSLIMSAAGARDQS